MIRHLAGIAEIVDDLDAAVRFYRDTLGLPVELRDPAGYAEVKLSGVLHFGLWLREHAARATGVPPERVALGAPPASSPRAGCCARSPRRPGRERPERPPQPSGTSSSTDASPGTPIRSGKP
jgi:catechol 2,3-dioxygenase-like lactoylglutathione lyase family enzyme